MVRMRKHLALKAAVTEARDYARLTRNRRKRSTRQLQRLNKKLNIIHHTLELNTPTTNDPSFEPEAFHDPQGVFNNSLQTHNIVLPSQRNDKPCQQCSEADTCKTTRSRTCSSNNASDQTPTDDHCSIDIMSQEDNSDITPSELKAELKNCGDHKVKRNSARAPFSEQSVDLFLITSVVTFSDIITTVCRQIVCAVFKDWFGLRGHKLGLAAFCNNSKSTCTSQQNG